MPAKQDGPCVLLVESDVIVRFALAEYLRACAATVIEAPSAADARAVLVAGPIVDILMSDAQLAGDENGFALARWVRRHRPDIEVILTSSIPNKAQIVSEFCARYPDSPPNADAASLAARIQTMLAERKRRTRPSSTSATMAQKSKRN